MRNLKRALSLALASVMLLGMMVVGTSAASYPDVDSKDNLEAIEVMQAVGVMEGDDKGNFNPDAKVTRNEMAVVMCNLLGLDASDFAGTNPFTDVPAWAAPYVAACKANGIVSGASATTYNGAATVTAAEAGLMMMKALGYFQYAGDFADDWQLATIRQAADIKLFDKIEAGAKTALTRNEIAQLALNTLKSDVVRFTGTLGTEITTSDGTSIMVGYQSEYTARGSLTGVDYNSALTGHDFDTLQLAEKLYDGKLTVGSVSDNMKRPATQWTYKGNTVGTYNKAPAYTVVIDEPMTVQEALDDINKTFDVTTKNHGTGAGKIVSLNGAAFTTVAAAANLKVGDVMEVYMDSNVVKQVNNVAITQYTAAKLSGNVATKGEGDQLEVRVPGVVGAYTDAEDVKGYEGLKKDDIVYYYVDGAGVYHIAKAESFEGKLTGTKTGTPVGYVIDGKTRYINGNVATVTGVNSAAVYNTGYEYFVDANGYLIYAKEVEKAKSDYVIIDKIVYVGADGSINGSDRVEAKLVKMDGTTEVVPVESVSLSNNPASHSAYTKYIDIDTTDKTSDTTGANGSDKYLVFDENTAASTITPKLHSGLNGHAKTTFFTYTTNSDGEYALTEVVNNSTDKITVGAISNNGTDNAANAEIKTNAATVYNNIAVNGDTVFVVANKASNAKGYVTYTGSANVPDIILNATDAGLTAVVAKNGIATHVYVSQYRSTSLVGDTVFFLSTTPDSFEVVKADDGTVTYNNIYKALVNGEATTVKVKANVGGTNALDSGSVKNELQSPTYKDGVIVSLVDATEDVSGAQSYVLSNGTLVVNGSAAYTCADDAVVYLVDEDLNVVKTTASELTEDDNDKVFVVKTEAAKAIVKYLVIYTMDDNEVALSALSGDNSLPALDKAKTTQTVAGAASTAYTITATAKDGKADVKFSQDNGSTWAAANGTTNKVTLGAAGSGNKEIWIRVTAVDDTYEIYKITITCPAV